MRHPAARWSVLAVAVVAAAGACYWAAQLERHALERRRTLALATADARGLQAALADTRRAVSAMASPGQAAVSWSRQATASIDAARQRLSALMATEGGAALRPHAERLDKLADAEARLRENAVGGRTLMASDVAFGEALPHVDALDHQVAETLGTIGDAAERDLAATRDRQILALAGALGVLGVAAVLLTPAPRQRDTDAGDSVVETPDPGADGVTPDVAAPLAAMPPPTPAPMPVPAAPRVDLSPLAAACGALARLADGETLPAVLDTVRPALGARGVAVWLADGDRQLQVVASSGYDARVVERFPVVRAGDDNPTARAFARTAPMATPARAGQPAAVAVPITGSRGTSGVLSIEMQGTREAGTDVVAAAGIIAAQLSALLEPLPAVDAAVAGDAPAGDTPLARAENL